MQSLQQDTVSAKEKAMALSTRDLGELLKFFVTRSRDKDSVPLASAEKLFSLGLIQLDGNTWVMPKDIMPLWDYWDLRDLFTERNNREVRLKIREEKGLNATK